MQRSQLPVERHALSRSPAINNDKAVGLLPFELSVSHLRLDDSAPAPDKRFQHLLSDVKRPMP